MHWICGFHLDFMLLSHIIVIFEQHYNNSLSVVHVNIVSLSKNIYQRYQLVVALLIT